MALILVTAWTVIFLVTARYQLRGLPQPIEEVPPYILWLEDDQAVPRLEPPPIRVHRGTKPIETACQILRLGRSVRVCENLPKRLAACGHDFVSVFPKPLGSVGGRAGERIVRDLAGLSGE